MSNSNKIDSENILGSVGKTPLVELKNIIPSGYASVFVIELKRTCELEAKAVNIECFGRFIRSSQVHVPLSLTVPASCSEYR